MCLHKMRSEEYFCSSPQADSWNTNDSIGWAQCTRKAEPLGFQQIVGLCSLTQCSSTNLFYNTHPSPKAAEHQKPTVLLSWSSELQCKWGRGKLERKSPSWKRAGPPTRWNRACSQVTLETSMAVTFSLLFQPNTLPPQSPSNPSNHLQIKNLTNMFSFLLWASAAEALLCCSVFVSVPQDQVPQYQGKKDFMCVHYVHTEFSLIRVWNHCNTNYLHQHIGKDSITQPYLSANPTCQMGTYNDFMSFASSICYLDTRVSCALYLLNISPTFCSDLSTYSGWNTSQAVS